jgi:hypothetical protein
MSTYVALALASYMTLHPIPEDILEKYLEPKPTPSSSSDTQALKEELAQTKAQLATANETIARSAETIATLTRLLEQERVRPDVT